MTSPELKRTLGLFDAFALVISAVVGAGIYAVTGVAARLTGPSLVLSVLAAGLVAALTAASLSRLVRAFPREGGEYEYGYKTISPFAGFLSGWMWNINKVFSDAAVALVFAAYLSRFIPAVPARPAAVAVVALVTAVNYAGIKTAGRAVSGLSVATLLILFIFVACGIFFIRPANFQPFVTHGAGGVFRASAVMFFAYVGFSRPVYLVEEFKNPAHTVPRGILLGLSASAAIYLLVAAAAVGLAGSEALSQSSLPLATAAGFTPFPWLTVLISAGALIATFSVLLSDNLGLSRMMFAMGRRGDYPRWLGHIGNARLPRRAVIVSGLLTAAFVLVVSFVNLVQIASFFILVYFALAHLSALRLKERGFARTLSVLGIIATLGLAFSLSASIILTGLVLIAAGAIYLFIRKRGFTRPLLLKPER